jgi:hypothetical protein
MDSASLAVSADFFHRSARAKLSPEADSCRFRQINFEQCGSHGTAIWRPLMQLRLHVRSMSGQQTKKAFARAADWPKNLALL